MTEKNEFLRLYIVEASGLYPRWGERDTRATRQSLSGIVMADPVKGSL